jgi:hypothetical protein
MCAAVCPSQALFFGTHEEIRELRPQSMPTNVFQFGEQTIKTRVLMMVPRREAPAARIDVLSAMDAHAEPRLVRLTVLGSDAPAPSGPDMADPFAEVEI